MDHSPKGEQVANIGRYAHGMYSEWAKTLSKAIEKAISQNTKILINNGSEQ